MYKQKYLKYKQKYLALKQLKNLRGGSSFEELDFNTLPLQTLKILAAEKGLSFDEESDKNELVMLLNSYHDDQKSQQARKAEQERQRQEREARERQRQRQEREAIARLGARARETELARTLQESREAKFQTRFGRYDLDNINITESEIAEANLIYGDVQRKKIIDFIKDNKRQEIKSRVESDPEYLKLLTCQIRSTKPLFEQFKKYQENASERYTQLRIAINSVFNERGWYIADARGDGRCMIHSIIHGIRDILKLNTVEINEPFELIVFNAFKRYFTISDDNFLTFDLNIGRISIQKTDSDKTLQDKILILLNQNNISDELFKVLAIYFNINILQISGDTYQFMFQHVSELNPNNCIIIMQYSGHYRLIYNQNNNITKQKIEEILRNKNTDVVGHEKNIKVQKIHLENGFWYISDRQDFNDNSAAGGGGYDLEQERALNEQREREQRAIELNEQREREQRARELNEQRERALNEQREREQRARELNEQRERALNEQREREQRARELNEQREREKREKELNKQRDKLNKQKGMLRTFDNDTIISILQSYGINNLSNASKEIKINAIMDYLQKHPELLP